MPYKRKEDKAAQMRRWRQQRKDQAAHNHLELEVRRATEVVKVDTAKVQTDHDLCMKERLAAGDCMEAARDFCEPLKTDTCEQCGGSVRKFLTDTESGESSTFCPHCHAITDSLEATPMQRCVAARMQVHEESEQQATVACERWMHGRIIRGAPKGDLKHMNLVDEKFQKKYDFYRMALGTDDVDMLTKAMHDDEEYGNCVSAELVHGATKEEAERTCAAKMKEKEPGSQKVPATVGDLYMKSKEEIIKETSRFKSDTRFTQDNIRSYEERKAEYDKCVTARVAAGMTRGQAAALCEAATKPADEPGPHKTRLTVGSTYGMTTKQILEEQTR